MKTVTKSQFKPRAFEYFRMVEEQGEPLTITDHGRPAVLVSPVEHRDQDAAGSLEGVIQAYADPEAPVGVNEWEAGR
jgi:prevent-host-death family protein